MKQFFLAAILIIIPVAAISAFEVYFAETPAAAATLGDLTSLKAIITDVQSIAATGDLAAAATRITDFETAWDDGQSTMRPLNAAAWGTVDDASDAALHALRAKAPDAAKITATLAGLMAALNDPSAGGTAASGGVKLVSGIAVTDATGHPIACEVMIKDLTAAISGGKITKAGATAADDFLSKATERCNADDDMHADEFSAQGLALASQ